jgi:hypothetical protein
MSGEGTSCNSTVLSVVDSELIFGWMTMSAVRLPAVMASQLGICA